MSAEHAGTCSSDERLSVPVHAADRHESPSAGVRGSPDPLSHGGAVGVLSGDGEESSGRTGQLEVSWRSADSVGADSSHLCVCFQARVSRIQQIEKDIVKLGARLQVSSPVACPAVSQSPVS